MASLHYANTQMNHCSGIGTEPLSTRMASVTEEQGRIDNWPWGVGGVAVGQFLSV